MKISKIVQLATFVALLCTSQANAAVAVIVHPSNSDALDTNAIAKIFTGKQKAFPSGAEAIPVDLEQGSATKVEFVSTVLNKSESQMKAYWAKLMFSGKGTPPREMSSDADVVALVAKNPSIIGYVDASTVDASVKVIHQF